jgi:hypothetical protein
MPGREMGGFVGLGLVGLDVRMIISSSMGDSPAAWRRNALYLLLAASARVV